MFGNCPAGVDGRGTICRRPGALVPQFREWRTCPAPLVSHSRPGYQVARTVVLLPHELGQPLGETRLRYTFQRSCS